MGTLFNTILNRSSRRLLFLRIIRPIMQWNLQSNVCDVLALGPRTAGRLATVEIRTVAELLAAKPQTVVVRLCEGSITPDILIAWQYEASLIVALPQLPASAARLLAAAGFRSAERIGYCTPTELLAAIETTQQKKPNGWLAKTTLPTVAEVGEWIHLARESKKSFAA